MTPSPDEPFYDLLSPAEAAQRLDSDPSRGLSPDEARRRLARYGSNRLTTQMGTPSWRILVRQFESPMVLLMLGVAGISLFLHHVTDAVVVGVIALLNGGIGFFQERRAEKAMAAIRGLAAPRARVLRDGTPVTLPAEEITAGDVVELVAGDRVPADLRLIQAIQLHIDEALLTGESLPVAKDTAALKTPAASPGDRRNVAFAGTHVIAGKGRGLCVAVGMRTEIGRIAVLVGEAGRKEVPLRRRMNELSRRLVLAACLLCVLVIIMGLIQGKPLLDMLYAAVSLAVAAIPEGLPVVITVALSLGALTLSRKGALVRHLQAVEGLGSVTTICTDKTGTLTSNRMAVRHCHCGGQTIAVPEGLAEGKMPLQRLVRTAVLCNTADHGASGVSDGEGPRKTSGDPMEVALLTFAEMSGRSPNALRRDWRLLREIPFDSVRKRMTVVVERNGQRLAMMKGAPEVVLQASAFEAAGGRDRRISAEGKVALLKTAEGLAGEGMRVLGFAERVIGEDYNDNDADTDSGVDADFDKTENDMTFLGLVALEDPPRVEAAEAVRDCHAAGIRVVMITGDHAVTAARIARELNILDENGTVLTGADLRGRDAGWLRRELPRAEVFARVSPADKLVIVETLKQAGELVAMTGDGVNDAPALKASHIGLAMGRGTDVAKEASDLVLVGEDFSTIAAAVSTGRGIYDNIRKFVRYMLTTNLGEIATVLLAVSFGLPMPLLPVQILWINLVTDGLPAVALGFEPADPDVMRRPPRDPAESVLGRGLWQHALWVGLSMGVIAVVILWLSLEKRSGLDQARTSVFTALVVMQMAHVLAIRSETRPLWRLGVMSNHRLAGAVFLTLALQAALVLIPPLGRILHTVGLNAFDVMLSLGAGILIYTAVEIEKAIQGRRLTNIRGGIDGGHGALRTRSIG